MFGDVPRPELMAASPGPQKLIIGIRTSPSSAIRMDRTQKHHARLAIPAKEGKLVSMGGFGVKFKISGDEILLAGPGDYILKPRGIPHTFWNPTDKVARLVEIISPAGFEKFFAEAGELFTQGPPEVERVGALAAEYNTTFGWNEWVSELTKKYKLKLFG